jgi:hypothetical protein
MVFDDFRKRAPHLSIVVHDQTARRDGSGRRGLHATKVTARSPPLQRRVPPHYASPTLTCGPAMTRILPHDHEHRFRLARGPRRPGAGAAGAVMTPSTRPPPMCRKGLAATRDEYAHPEPDAGGLGGHRGPRGHATASRSIGPCRVNALLKLLRSGDHACAEKRVRRHAPLDGAGVRALGLSFTFVDMRDVANVDRAITPSTGWCIARRPPIP